MYHIFMTKSISLEKRRFLLGTRTLWCSILAFVLMLLFQLILRRTSSTHDPYHLLLKMLMWSNIFATSNPVFFPTSHVLAVLYQIVCLLPFVIWVPCERRDTRLSYSRLTVTFLSLLRPSVIKVSSFACKRMLDVKVAPIYARPWCSR